MFKELLIQFNGFFTLYLIFPFILLLGLYLSWRLKLIQVFKLKMSIVHLFKKDEKDEGTLTHFQAVASVLAANFGTGNISGMAIALATGGPGSLVWMWVMAFFGSAIQFASCLLGVKYRQKIQGEYMGGPMYYLREGLGLKKIAVLFSICVILVSFTLGSFVQVNSMTLPLKQIGISPWLVGVTIALLSALVILGGVQRIAKASSAIVPIMAFFYLLAAFVVLALHGEHLFAAFKLMFQSAFSGMSLGGGVLGFTIMKALTTGFDRGILATDAGTGAVPILQSGAKTKHPVIDGVVSIFSPFLVMIVCTTTALVLIVTGAFVSDFRSTDMVVYAFQKGLGDMIGLFVVITALFLFGYTTLLAWASCLQQSVSFVFGSRFVRPSLLLYVLFVPVGALLDAGIVWVLADIFLTAMMFFNLIGVTALSKEVIEESRIYFAKQRSQHLLINDKKTISS
ncbi:MAG: amino acid carrier protein [Chlamydiales bacterium]